MKKYRKIALIAFFMSVCLTACQAGGRTEGVAQPSAGGQPSSGEQRSPGAQPSAGEPPSSAEQASSGTQPESMEQTSSAIAQVMEGNGENAEIQRSAGEGEEANLQAWAPSPADTSEKTDKKPVTGEGQPSAKEAVSVYYGAICYSLYSEDADVIKTVADIFRQADLEEVEAGGLDADTTFQVYFTTGEEQLAAVNVDKNGIFYLPEEQKFYRDRSGRFSYDQLDKLYQDSMKADGFDAGQCLIP